MAATIILVTKPFSLCKLLVLFGLKVVAIVFQTWMELLRTSVMTHLNMFRKAIIWVIALVSLPSRVLTALQRERLLEENLHNVRIELDNLFWDRKELADQLQKAVKECRMLELMLSEVEEENDKAAAKIELLDAELQDLKVENLQLKEIQDTGSWGLRDYDGTGNRQKIGVADDYGLYKIQSWKSNYNGSGIVLQDLMLHKDQLEGEGKSNQKSHNFSKSRSTASRSVPPFAPDASPRHLDINEVMDKRREVAFSQSLFSAILSLFVGIIIWQADDPCMPLVVALFTVVGMSLKSVVQFFSTIDNKPASDAVALLSFNWFILGALTYPTLPIVARILLHWL